MLDEAEAAHLGKARGIPTKVSIIADETPRGSDKEREAIAILAWMWNNVPECQHVMAVERERRERF
jgi:hypothetical protein